ncbi:MAG TPA: serine/threonine-protein kinase PknK, partial [Chitinophagales bacterium]|nr:serine/threonine-protein kinase PknK [Chitinophagales bacterium]
MSVTTPADAIADMSGYKLLEKIYASGHCLFYRAVRTADNTPVIIKQFISEYPTASVVSRFQNEFQLAGSLPLTGVLQPLALITLDKAPGIVYEDFNFISLKNYVKKNTPELSAALKIGIQLAEALEGIHLNNIVLKGINPYNILIDTGRLAVKIADFSSADRFEMEHAAIKKTKDAVQSLAYISPEQTGRMNCTMDYRTDFYSLGVTLYETFTGRLPFDYDDKLQLLYCHLAQIPPAPHLLNKNIPAAVSAIILKLLAKKADERYQTASGIKADLKKCLEKLNSAGKVEEFELGKEDISKRFRVSQKLYGRESQISEMLQAFSRVSRGAAEVFMVTGYSGIGKSSLVYEIHKPVLQNRGYFISGKFDQYKRDVPYFSLVQAFQDLVKQILTESDEAIALWKKKLTEALAPNGQLIIEVIPEVESIIGKQQPVPELPPAESQNRFNLVFLEFVKVFSSPTHPLAVFLDDLQWSDLASLRLIELITGDTTIHHLFLIGAYRNNEVSATHPLTITLEKIRKSPAVLHTIILEPLSLTDINHLLADSLSASAEKTKSLALLSGQKTNGNPFFLNQFLKTLYQEQLLYFDGNAKQWAWEIEKIKQQNITENVVELMAGKIQKLGNPVQQTLMLAACIGSRFDLKTLAVVCEKTPAEVSCELLPALAEGLLVPLNADYNYAGDLPGSVFYEFLHDRVQQAAYSLIDERYRKTVHLKIGRLLLDNTPEEAMDDEVFNIISHLNTAMDLIESPAEKALLARLNLSAGKKAMASVAFQSALRYFETGIRLLGNSSWEHHYDLTLSLYNEATEASYVVTDFFSMRRLADEALRNAQSLLDKLKVYEVMISASISQDKMLEAVQQALEVLRLLGAKFPPNPGKGDILFSLLRTQWLLAGKKPEDLENLPLMSDPAYRAVMRIMARINSASYLAMPSLLPLLVLKATRMSVKYGNTEESAYAFALYGMILCGVLGDIDKGYRFGNLAMRLVQKLNIRFYKTRVHLGVSDFVTHWKEPLRNTFEPMLEGYRSGLETGDFEFAGFIAHNYCSHLYFAGVNLKEVNSEINKYSSVMRSLEHKAALLFNDLFQQAVLNFMGKNEDPRFLMGEVYDERKMLQVHRELRQGTAIYYMYVNKLMLCYHFEDYQRAIENAENAEKNLESAIALYAVPL